MNLATNCRMGRAQARSAGAKPINPSMRRARPMGFAALYPSYAIALADIAQLRPGDGGIHHHGSQHEVMQQLPAAVE